jgi:methylenetetrahydrofolate dehydrogenase (NADP+) / methenyltetrahydrofolate cyclohydrolase
MAAKIIDGKSLAAQVRDSLKNAIATLAARGVRPGLAAILAGNDPASRVYVRNKARACDDAGVRSEIHELPESVSESALLERVAQLNADRAVHGVLVQLPLPRHLDAHRVLEAISPAKDVDGFHAVNLGALVQGRPGFVPGTPAGVMRLIEHAGVGLAGRHAVIVGRSTIVGKPLALLLLQKDATVTICHSKTADLASVTRQADILVAAVGKARMITAPMVKPGACVIDVGINRLADGKLAGDVDFAGVKEVAGAITPVPGGVGPMTVAMLMANTVRAAELFLEH